MSNRVHILAAPESPLVPRWMVARWESYGWLDRLQAAARAAGGEVVEFCLRSEDWAHEALRLSRMLGPWDGELVLEGIGVNDAYGPLDMLAAQLRTLGYRLSFERGVSFRIPRPPCRLPARCEEFLSRLYGPRGQRWELFSSFFRGGWWTAFVLEGWWCRWWVVVASGTHARRVSCWFVPRVAHVCYFDHQGMPEGCFAFLERMEGEPWLPLLIALEEAEYRSGFLFAVFSAHEADGLRAPRRPGEYREAIRRVQVAGADLVADALAAMGYRV